MLDRLGPQLAELRSRLGHDGRRLQRATGRLLRQHRVRPLRNLAASSLQILLFVLLFAAVDTVARAQGGTTFGALLATPDPTLLLPASTAVLALMLLWARGRAKSRLHAGLRVAAAALLVALVWPLSLALQFYLACSLGLAVAHGRLVRKYCDPVRPSPRPAFEPVTEVVLPLARADQRPDAGAKAARLACLTRAGLPVPDGFVVCGEAFAAGIERLNGTIDSVWSRLASPRVAVRSSGTCEDGARESRAGIYESILNVERSRLESALAEVHGSLNGTRARAQGGVEDRGGVLVQAMVPADFAGVLFTEDPGCSGCGLVELVPGLGHELVAGRATPQAYRYTRLTGRLLDEGPSPVDLLPLIELGRRVEALFGRPQDIEWAFASGSFHLLQARDITRDAGSNRDALGRRERERRRLLQLCKDLPSDRPVLGLTELCELLPEPTPYSYALMESLWAAGGSVDLACRELGIRYDIDEDSPPYVVTAFGRLYVNLSEPRRRFARGIGAVAGLRLGRDAEAIERDFREQFAPALAAELRLREVLDFERMALPELLALRAQWHQRFVTGTYVRAEVVNLAAEHYAESARRRLAQAGLDPSVLLAAFEPTILHQAWELLREQGPGAGAEFLAVCGHRAPHDFELAEPRYAETPQLVAAMARDAQQGGSRPRPPRAHLRGRILRLVADRALRFQTLKEDAKHICLRELATLRQLLLAIGAHSGLGDLVFFLEPGELDQLGADTARAELALVADERRRCRFEWRELDLPQELSAAELETMFQPWAAATQREHEPGIVRGEHVAGDRDSIGRVRRLDSVDQADELEPGDILVARFTDPSWTPLFRRAGGIVTEIGGWLSHAAIQARESNLPAIVGARGVLTAFRDGELVQLGRDGTVRSVPDRRREPRQRQDCEIWLVTADGPLHGRLLDVSAGGARVRCAALPLGARVRLHLAGTEQVCEVVRQAQDGIGLRRLG